MRTIIHLVAALALAACAPGHVIVVHRPAPPPPPPRIEPLEIAVARPIRGHLLVQTSRPAYVALFEIVPDRGVALIAPTYVHQRTWMLAGLNWVPVSWKVQSTMYYGPPSAHGVPGRWVYAIASDEPLRLPAEAFRPGYLQRALGPTVYRSRNPYITMRALSRLFVPAVVDEAWAEDAYALAATYASDPYRTVRIYCANRSVYEVPEELADRAWCPVTQGNTGTAVRNAPSRPDSVVMSNGQRVRRRMPETRTVYRVREPSATPGTPATDGNRGNPPVNNNAGNNANTGGNNAGNPHDGVARDSSRARRGGGNAYGHTDDPNVRGRGIENEKQQRQTPAPQNDKGRPKDKELDGPKDAPPSNSENDPRREPRADPPSRGRNDQPVARPDHPAHVDEKPAHQPERPNEQRQEEKQAEKAADKVEHKQPEKAAEKPQQKPDLAQPAEPPRESKPEAKPPEAKPEKSEPGVQQPQAEKQEAKPDKPDAKPEPKGDDAKGQGKPDNKPDVKDAKGQQGGPEEPGKKDQKGKP